MKNSEMSACQNPYVSKLLHLQQDGQQSEIGPHNWEVQPTDFPLVLTPQVEAIMASADQLIKGGTSGVWHFLVGAPGNGKSALIGILVRKLLNNGWENFSKKTNDKRLSHVTELRKPSASNKEYSQLVIVQDASVSAEPHDPNSKLATELKDVLLECFEAGKSVLVCANRGVLEGLPELLLSDDTKKLRSVIRKGLKKKHEETIDSLSTSKNRVYKTLSIKFDHLDHETLLGSQNSEGVTPVGELINLMTSQENWKVCESCSSSRLCPFYNNQKLLSTTDVRSRFLDLLGRAETYRNQPIVFRECIALFSTILSGVPSDYIGRSPCDWVHNVVRDKNYLTLIDRRLYQIAFSDRSRGNLCNDSAVEAAQLENLKLLTNSNVGDTEHIKSFLNSLPTRISASGDLRLALAALDPALAPQDANVVDSYSFDSPTLRKQLASEGDHWALEIEAIDAWKETSRRIQNEEYAAAADGLQVLNRITTMSLIRLGALNPKLHVDFVEKFEVVEKFENEIKNYKRLIKLIGDRSNIDQDEAEWIMEQQTTIAECVALASGYNAKWSRLMDNLEVKNESLNNLSPLSICRDVRPPYLSIDIKFGSNSSIRQSLSAEVYCWISKTRSDSKCKLAPESIPEQLLSGLRVARRNAIAKSGYLTDADVEISADDEHQGRLLMRKQEWSGDVIVDAEHGE